MSELIAMQAGPISDGLYNDILAGILLGDYPPQSRLPTEQRLACDYGVSRTVVRCALEQLKVEGVVHSRQGSGTVVAKFDPKRIARLNRDAQLPTLKDCYACRLAIEPAVAAIVAHEPSAEACAFLTTQRIVLENGDEGSEHERSARDAQFHILLAKYSGNAFFSSIMMTLRPHILFAMNVSKTLASGAQEQHFNLARQEHLDIIAAILNRDPEAASDAMRLHLETVVERIFQTKESDIGCT